MKRADLTQLFLLVEEKYLTQKRLGGYSQDAATLEFILSTLGVIIDSLIDKAPKSKIKRKKR